MRIIGSSIIVIGSTSQHCYVERSTKASTASLEKVPYPHKPSNPPLFSREERSERITYTVHPWVKPSSPQPETSSQWGRGNLWICRPPQPHTQWKNLQGRLSKGDTRGDIQGIPLPQGSLQAFKPKSYYCRHVLVQLCSSTPSISVVRWV